MRCRHFVVPTVSLSLSLRVVLVLGAALLARPGQNSGASWWAISDRSRHLCRGTLVARRHHRIGEWLFHGATAPQRGCIERRTALGSPKRQGPHAPGARPHLIIFGFYDKAPTLVKKNLPSAAWVRLGLRWRSMRQRRPDARQ